VTSAELLLEQLAESDIEVWGSKATASGIAHRLGD
jgi:hypothetical protein